MLLKLEPISFHFTVESTSLNAEEEEPSLTWENVNLTLWFKGTSVFCKFIFVMIDNTHLLLLGFCRFHKLKFKDFSRSLKIPVSSQCLSRKNSVFFLYRAAMLWIEMSLKILKKRFYPRTPCLVEICPPSRDIRAPTLLFILTVGLCSGGCLQWKSA